LSLATSTYVTENAASGLALLRTGHTRVNAPLVDPDMLRRFRIAGMASAPFVGTICRGRMFVLDRADFHDDHLLLTDIIASRMAIELDRQVLQVQAEDAAAMRERIFLARDLHDGVLQSLTAVGLQLKLMSEQLNDESRDRLNMIKQLLAHEQRRIREFVQAMRADTALTGDVVLGQNLHPGLTEVARNWNCALSFRIEPEDAAVSKRLATQVSLMLAEAIANAVRHGEAATVDVAVRQVDGSLAIAVRDDGRGFGGAANESASHSGPISLRGRIAALGGSLEVLNSSTGAELRIRLPIA
jgi:signal transduction histidine kinase